MDPQAPTPPSDSAVPQVPTDAPVAAPAAPNVKQQFVEKVNGAKNVLVTVGTNPTVDELAGALGLTFLLGKLQKHVTAVFSGKTPPAIDFLDPDKTFERTVDSLRDFIIALDKEKADKLRYKVEDDVVKVFITPYRTTITEKDLQYSQGDFNVDVIVALGITKKEDLDKAIVAHGRILHDAEVITINSNGKKSNLGSIDWSDDQASSVSEMLVSVSESFGSGLLDEQISTALLTGIVAETNRFSNEKTSPKVMTMAAQLMAAGANQQLIATNLRQEGMISESVRNNVKNQQAASDDGEMVLSHGEEKLKSAQLAPKNKSTEKPAPSKESAKADTPSAPEKPVVQPDKVEALAPKAAGVPAPTPDVPPVAPAVAPGLDHTMLPPLPSATPEIIPDANKVQAEQPTFGGTLNATTSQAAEDRAEEFDREQTENNTTLEHGAVAVEDNQASLDAIEAARQAVEELTEASSDPANNPTQSVGAQELPAVHDQAQLPELPVLPAMDTVPNPDGQAGHMQAQTSVLNTASATVVEEPSPVDAFMQPHQDEPQAQNPLNVPFSAPGAAPAPEMPPLPPLPPMPGGPQSGAMPPPPPMPGRPTDPTAGFQPDLGPAFAQGIPQSQNSWTQAADDMAAKQADKQANRQERLDQIGAQYDAAVDQNLINQGKQPINNPNDHTTFPLPPTR